MEYGSTLNFEPCPVFQMKRNLLILLGSLSLALGLLGIA